MNHIACRPRNAAKKNHVCYSFFLLATCLFTMHAEAQKPSITTFTPASGAIGTNVIITGANFSPTPANNTVHFGAVRATVLAATSTSLTVTVPAGATYQSPSVTVNGLTAYASKPFIVIFPGGGSGFSSSSFASAVDSLAGYSITYLAISDIDDDGKPDVAVINQSANKVSLFRNTSRIGVVSFAAKIDYVTGGSPSSISFEDLDGDGKRDMVISNAKDSTVSVYKNASSSGVISFVSKTEFNTGGAPVSTAIADLDGDGQPDLAVVNSGANTVSILRNTSQAGVISFAAKTDLNTGNTPSSIAISDLDGDGKPDLAVTNYKDNTISVFKNTSATAALSFTAKSDYPVTSGGSPIYITAADLNADGMPDLAVAYSIPGTVSILKNTSSGGVISLAPKTDYGIYSSSFSLAVTDLDGDGMPDLAAANDLSPRVAVLRNLSAAGNISFGSYSLYYTGNNPYSLSIADMDGDGRPDIVMAEYNSGTISVQRNMVPLPNILSFTPTTAGDGSVVAISGVNFKGVSSVRIGGVAPSSYTVDSSTGITAIVDTGASGNVEVTNAYGTAQLAGFVFSKTPTILSFTPVSGSSGTTVTITGTNFNGTTGVSFGGNPAASFTVVSPGIITATVGTITTGSLAVSVTTPSGMASLDGFYTGPTIRSFIPSSGPVGTQVIILGTHFSKTAGNNIVYFGAVQATVTNADSNALHVIVPSGATYEPITVTTNNLTAFSAQPFLVTFKGTGGGFTPASFVDKADSSAGGFPIQTCVSDLNGDGKPDLVTINTWQATISVLRNTSAGGAVSFAGMVDYAEPGTLTGNIAGATADLDGDGKPDIVVTKAYDYTTFTDSISIFRNTSSAGSITLAAPLNFYAGLEVSPSWVAINDFDGDGKPDIALAAFGGGDVSVLKNTSLPGAISFAPIQNFGIGGQSLPSSVFATDVDGDGKPDLIVTDHNAGFVYILRNTSANGVISFAHYIYFQTGFSPQSVAFGDLDNDGLPDMVITNGGNNSVSVFKNTSRSGVISFAASTDYPLGNIPYNVSIGDLDGDGKPDLVVATRNLSTMAILKNLSSNGTLSFANPVLYNDRYGYQFIHVTIADINGDGKPDLIGTSNASSTNVSVFINGLPDDGLPTVGIAISGPTEICQGDSTILTVNPVITGGIYQWYKDGIPISHATDSAYTAILSGSYSVSVVNAGIMSTSSALAITIKSIPDTPVISISDSLLCQGRAIDLVSSSPAGNTWYRDGVSITEATDIIYRVTDSGSYTVMTGSNGCSSALSNSIPLTLTSLPSAVVTPAGPETICEGGNVILNANPGSGLSYQWNTASNPVPGANAPTFTANVTGDYTVTVNNRGCPRTSSVTTVTQLPTPDKPTITKNATGLASSALNGNQWYRNGVVIAGASGQTYIPTDAATYSVAVTINGCTGPRSDGYVYTVTVTGIIAIDNTHYIKLAPNPVKDQVLVSFNVDGTPLLNIEMVDLNGRITRRWGNIGTGTVLNLSALSSSIYFARIYSPDGRLHYALKVLKE